MMSLWKEIRLLIGQALLTLVGRILPKSEFKIEFLFALKELTKRDIERIQRGRTT